jgi:hypothetical protein
MRTDRHDENNSRNFANAPKNGRNNGNTTWWKTMIWYPKYVGFLLRSLHPTIMTAVRPVPCLLIKYDVLLH